MTVSGEIPLRKQPALVDRKYQTMSTPLAVIEVSENIVQYPDHTRFEFSGVLLESKEMIKG